MPSLLPGTRLGAYEILGAIGEGGMGEVYRARDTRLDRDVALKILPEAFASDPDRLMRFEREAKTLASLNHPHIAQIYGFESGTSGGAVAPRSHALVMELVDGEDLAQRIARGAIPIEDALPIARQIAEALEAAHEQGIIHRDLKPANVKVRADGTVKVLDFGLAKALDQVPGTRDRGPGNAVLNSPTITSPAMTAAGMILGTAAYMAPEQAKGKPLDRRVDIWAFGCVLYEMLVGRRAFGGEDITDTLTAIMRDAPDVAALPANVPIAVRHVIARCLDKDPRTRLRDIGEARVLLDSGSHEVIGAAPVPSTTPPKTVRLVWFIAAVATLGLIASLVQRQWRAPVDPLPMRVEVTTRPAANMLQLLDFALAPTGRAIVFSGGAEGAPLWLKSLDTGEAKPLPGTEDARFPFWSPDGRSLGFFAAGKLKRVDVAGGEPVALADAIEPVGGSWNTQGTIVFVPSIGSAVMRVSVGGGQPTAATTFAAGDILQGYPTFLADADHFLYGRATLTSGVEFYIGSLHGGEPRPLKGMNGTYTQVAFLPPNHIVFLRGTELQAQRIDLERAELIGQPEAIASGVSSDAVFARAGFAVAADGTIAYRTGSVVKQLAWLDRSGRLLQLAGEADPLQVMATIAPDPARVALDRTVNGNRDVWIRDLDRGTTVRFTFGSGAEGTPVWSPDGQQIAFESDTGHSHLNMFVKRASGDGQESRLQTVARHQWPLDWSRDGKFLLYYDGENYRDGDLYAMPMTGEIRKPIPVATSRFAESSGSFSPDSQWVAYQTTESGRPEIVVQAFPDPAGGRAQVSVAGGKTPKWRPDGREVYFLGPDARLMAVPITTNERRLNAGTPVALFQTAIADWYGLAQFDVDRGGRLLVPLKQESTPPITLVLHWKPAS